MLMKNTSASSVIHQFLCTQSTGCSFTAKDLIETLGLSEGAVSGFLHKAVESGALVTAKVEGRRALDYIIKDEAALSLVRTKRTASSGSDPGRTLHNAGKRPPDIVTAKSLSERLFDIAAELERVRSPLSEWSTEDLLKELMRRNK